MLNSRYRLRMPSGLDFVRRHVLFKRPGWSSNGDFRSTEYPTDVGTPARSAGVRTAGKSAGTKIPDAARPNRHRLEGLAVAIARRATLTVRRAQLHIRLRVPFRCSEGAPDWPCCDAAPRWSGIISRNSYAETFGAEHCPSHLGDPNSCRRKWSSAARSGTGAFLSCRRVSLILTRQAF